MLSFLFVAHNGNLETTRGYYLRLHLENVFLLNTGLAITKAHVMGEVNVGQSEDTRALIGLHTLCVMSSPDSDWVMAKRMFNFFIIRHVHRVGCWILVTNKLRNILFDCSKNDLTHGRSLHNCRTCALEALVWFTVISP